VPEPEVAVSENAELQRIQGLMIFLASAANGLENLLGSGAPSITFRAGRTAGLKAAAAAPKEPDVDKALPRVWDEMVKLGIRWAFEPYKKAADSSFWTTNERGEKQLHLVFRHCMVRSALFRYCHPQKLSLCHMNHGLFCGLLEKICGQRCRLDIVHAGENACIKTLTMEQKG
jgi:hypothetical protein